jgi:hypothetical protein
VILSPKYAKILLILAVVADILVFSSATSLSIAFIGIGTAMILLGILYSYRLSSIVGFLIVSTVAANGADITSLTEIGPLMTALVGLLLPLFFLMWLALAAEEDAHMAPLMRRPLAISLVYAFICLWCVPLLVLALGVFFPTVFARVSTMTEIALMLTVTITGGIALTYREATRTTIQMAVQNAEKS